MSHLWEQKVLAGICRDYDVCKDLNERGTSRFKIRCISSRRYPSKWNGVSKRVDMNIRTI